MNWVLIIVVVALALIFFKFKEFRHRFGLIIGVVLLIFLIVTMGTLYATQKLDLSNTAGIVQAGKLYFNWLGTAGKNLIKVGGYVIKQDWSFNYTNSS